MKIKTILCDMDNGRFYVSDMSWFDPRFGLRTQPQYFRYIGINGWYPDKKARKYFNISIRNMN